MAGRERTYGFSHYFGLNDFLVQERSRPSSIAVRPELLADPARIGTALLDVGGPPLTATLGGTGDNRGALGIASALRDGQDLIARGPHLHPRQRARGRAASDHGERRRLDLRARQPDADDAGAAAEPRCRPARRGRTRGGADAGAGRERAHSDLDGRYLFAGSRSDTPPVALDPAFTAAGNPDDTYYRGDAVALTVRADDGLAFTHGITADREGFEELIGAIRTVVEADAVDDRALLERALELVNDALPKIAGYRAELGTRQARLEGVNVLHRDTEVYLQREISDVEDVDLADAVTRMTQQQVVIESAMATTGRLSQLSLADFLR